MQILTKPEKKITAKPAKISQYELEAVKAARAVMYAARKQSSVNTVRALYTGAELQPYIGRPGSEAALALPSRVGPRLHYRDGRVTDIAGNPLNRSKA